MEHSETTMLTHHASPIMRKDVAIIGMACLFPRAPDVQTYWENIVSKVDAITDPPEEWLADLIYDPDSSANDRIYCKRGGWLGDLARFDPAKYGVMPVAVDGSETDQFLALRVTYEALADAGVLDRPFDRERVEVILGRGTYVNSGNATVVQHGLVVDQTLRILKQLHPEYTGADLQAIKQELKASLPPFNAETAPGVIPNIMTGRIANRLDLGGPNFLVDGACASALIAVQLGMRDLLEGKCDLAIVGGVQAQTSLAMSLIFCQLKAMSRRGEIRAFDKDADGTLMGEGVGVIVLKRREDAERDGDRIYALIKGVGVASDGRGVGIMAPRMEGEVLALQRAYESAQLAPRTIELIEAHGTGTPVGDLTEIRALQRVFGPRDGTHPWCALGSVKSMIGPALPAAGLAGLIKTALALYHKVLPPTLHCDEPNPQFELHKTPFYVSTETRPWIHGALDVPRRAGVNAFGFGGINAHAILEEHNVDCHTNPDGDEAGSYHHREEDLSFHRLWDSEVLILQGDARSGLIERGQQIQRAARRYLAEGPVGALRDLAYSLNSQLGEAPYRLAIIASSLEDLDSKLARALGRLSDPKCTQIKHRSGIYFFEQPLGKQGELAFLFPGEGSQYVNMLADLCLHFPEVRAHFDRVDRAFVNSGRSDHLPSHLIFPPPNPQAEEDGLWQMEAAVAAVTTADRALLTLLSRLEIGPQALVGHSTGEFTALQAAGIMDLGDESLYEQYVADLDGIYQRAAAEDGVPRAALVAVGADSATTSAIVGSSSGLSPSDRIHIAMENCPHQTVVAGQAAAVEGAIEQMRRQGLIYEVLPFDRPYHTPLFEIYAEDLRPFFSRWLTSSPHVPLYSCTTMAPYPADLTQIQELAFQHWMRPVEFRKTIEAMYADGVRIFVEVGPRGNLTAFVDDILRSEPHLAVPSNIPTRSGITQLNHLVGLLAAQGVHMRLDRLYARRAPQKLSPEVADGDPRRRNDMASSMKLAVGLPTLRLERKAEGSLSSKDTQIAKGQTSQMAGGRAGERSDEWADVRVDQLASERASEVGRAARIEAQPPQLPSVQRTGIGHPPTPGQVRLSDPRSTVLEGYFQTMEHFLEAQQEVMQVFLAGSNTAAPLPSVTAPAIAHQPSAISYRPPQEEADRHGDRTVAPPVTKESEYESPPPVLSELAEAAETTAEASGQALSIGDTLLRLVSEKTGYPLEMLDLTLNLEADLGIDSIKRVEVLGALQREMGGLESEELEEAAGLRTLQEMIAFLEDRSARAHRTPPIVNRMPLIGTITSMIPGQELVALREISLDEDICLRDHALGRHVSVTDEGLSGLPVVPLTMSMEMMAEAAALLLPNRRPIGMRNVRAYRWIALEEQSVTLQITARCEALRSVDEVEVQVRESGDITALRSPIIEGEVIFGDAYPQPPSIGEFSLQSERPCKYMTPGRFYPKAMFHGPMFQGVVSMDRWGENGAEATVRGLPATEFFRSDPDPSFVIDPVLLDALGQVVGVWIADFPENGFVAFPFALEALYLYGPSLRPGERATCRAQVAMVGDERTRSDIDLVGQDARLRMRLVGWEDTGFKMPRSFFHFILAPGDVVVSSPWATALDGLPVSGALQCCRLDGFPRDLFAAHGMIWKRALAYLVLSHRERETWRNLSGPQKRRTEWLLGRVAAKDAVRLFLKDHCGMELRPADIEIVTDEHGRPTAQGPWTEGLKRIPIVSLAHSDGVAVAVAGDPGNGFGVGIDIERISQISKGTIKGLAFTARERELLSLVANRTSDEWSLRLWCAKEAVAKALGRGMIGGPHAFVAQELDGRTGRVGIALTGKMAELFPEFHTLGKTITAYTAREGGLIVATSLCEREWEYEEDP